MSNWNFTAAVGQQITQLWNATGMVSNLTFDQPEGKYARWSAIASVASAVIAGLTGLLTLFLTYLIYTWTQQAANTEKEMLRMERAAEMNLDYGKNAIQLSLQQFYAMVYQKAEEYRGLYGLVEPQGSKPNSIYGISVEDWAKYAEVANEYTSPNSWVKPSNKARVAPACIYELAQLPFVEDCPEVPGDHSVGLDTWTQSYILNFFPLYCHLKHNRGENLYKEDIAGLAFALRGFWERVEELHRSQQLPEFFLDAEDRPWLHRANSFHQVAELFDIATWFHARGSNGCYVKYSVDKYTDWGRLSVYSYIEMQWEKVMKKKPTPSIIFAIMEQHRRPHEVANQAAKAAAQAAEAATQAAKAAAQATQVTAQAAKAVAQAAAKAAQVTAQAAKAADQAARAAAQAAKAAPAATKAVEDANKAATDAAREAQDAARSTQNAVKAAPPAAQNAQAALAAQAANEAARTAVQKAQVANQAAQTAAEAAPAAARAAQAAARATHAAAQATQAAAKAAQTVAGPALTIQPPGANGSTASTAANTPPPSHNPHSHPPAP